MGHARPGSIIPSMDVTPTQTPGPVVVGVERSERALDGLALGTALARAAGAPLLLAAVYPADARSAAIDRGACERALAEEAQATLEWAADHVEGVRAELRAVRSLSVAKALRGLAEVEDALVIAVGPSHRGALGRIVPGSVGGRLLHGAPCPVAIAPR